MYHEGRITLRTSVGSSRRDVLYVSRYFAAVGSSCWMLSYVFSFFCLFFKLCVGSGMFRRGLQKTPFFLTC